MAATLLCAVRGNLITRAHLLAVADGTSRAVAAVTTSDVGNNQIMILWIVLFPNPIVSVKTSSVFWRCNFLQIPL